MTEFFLLMIFAVPCIGAVSVVLARDADWQHRLAVIAGLLTAVAALGLLALASPQAVVTVNIAGGPVTFAADGLGAFLAAVAAVIGALTLIFSVDYMRGEPQLGRYYALVLVFIAAMCGLALTGSLLLLFIFWEITALCSYALIAFHNDDPKAVRAGIQALVVTQLGGIGLLAGVLILRATLGTDSIEAALAGASGMPADLLALAAFGFLIAAAAKSAQVPFHIWLPGAMEAPTPVSALIHAATMVNAGVYLLVRFYPAFAGVPDWTGAVMLIGLLSALLAAVMALTATDLKRVLAYSTISQLGFMVYAVGTGGVFASQYHLLSHAVFKALLFLGAGAVIHAIGTRDLLLMGGLGKRMPVIRATFGFGILALAGIPIMNGFWSKELILEGSLHGAPVWMSAVMFAVAGLTALYSVRLMMLVFYGKPRAELHAHDAGSAMRVALVVLTVGALTTWLLALPFAQLMHDTLPLHGVEVHGDLFAEILSAPMTWLALGIVAVGAAIWPLRRLFAPLRPLLDAVAAAARADFGFAWLADAIVNATVRIAEAARTTQTGQLNWNAAGLVGGLVIVLTVLILGGVS